jgi:hypothetical protein
VIENVNANPNDITGRNEPVFLIRMGITRIGRDTNSTKEQKTRMDSKRERISSLFRMY